MSKELRYGSVCSGIEAASIAWEPLGWRPAWFSEIDPFPAAVLQHHWPDVLNLGDMTTIAERIRSGEVEAPDVLVGGTPCQAFSVAGLRQSLDDNRGNLTLKFVEIANAIDDKRQQSGKPPCIIAWENVPGIINTRDNALGCFFGGLVGAERPLEPAGGRWTNSGAVCGERRNVAWRVLDAQFFGVPQRRKRIYVVASAREISPWEILFERKSLRRNPESRRGKTQKIAAVAENSFRRCCKSNTAKNSIDFFVVHGTQDPCVSDKAFALGRNNGGENVIYLSKKLRKLTPVECERLQGFPDVHTQIPWRGKDATDCPDGLRYKAIGNSMAVPVMRWIGERIRKHLTGEI